MAGIVTNDGERLLLDAAVVNAGPLTVHLAQLDFEVADDLQVIDFTEANYNGYATQDLLYTGLEVGSPGGRAIADFAPLDFLCFDDLLPNEIYGYYVTDFFGEVVFVERFTGIARPMERAGQIVHLEITLRLWSPL